MILTNDKQLSVIQERERYWAYAVMLGLSLMVAFGVLVYKHMELNNVHERLDNCTGERMKLMGMAGAHGMMQEQLKELDELRAEVVKLNFEKGECLVSKNNLTKLSASKKDSTALVAKQADELLKLLVKTQDRAAKDAEQHKQSKDSCEEDRRRCEKELRRLQNATYQMLQNITLLVQDKETCDKERKSYADKLSSFEKKEEL